MQLTAAYIHTGCCSVTLAFFQPTCMKHPTIRDTVTVGLSLWQLCVQGCTQTLLEPTSAAESFESASCLRENTASLSPTPVASTPPVVAAGSTDGSYTSTKSKQRMDCLCTILPRCVVTAEIMSDAVALRLLCHNHLPCLVRKSCNGDRCVHCTFV